MTEDVIDFGPRGHRVQAPRPDRPSRLPGGIALPLAALGAALGAASCVGEWQSVTIPEEGLVGRGFSSPITSAGSFGTAYLVTLVVLITATVLTLFGDQRLRGTARLAGLALSGCALVLLAAGANLLSRTTEGADFQFYPPEAFGKVTFQLEWGIYAAFAGVIAIGVALALSRTTVPDVSALESAEEPEFDDDAIDMTVTVHPITR